MFISARAGKGCGGRVGATRGGGDDVHPAKDRARTKTPRTHVSLQP